MRDSFVATAPLVRIPWARARCQLACARDAPAMLSGSRRTAEAGRLAVGAGIPGRILILTAGQLAAIAGACTESGCVSFVAQGCRRAPAGQARHRLTRATTEVWRLQRHKGRTLNATEARRLQRRTAIYHHHGRPHRRVGLRCEKIQNFQDIRVHHVQVLV